MEPGIPLAAINFLVLNAGGWLSHLLGPKSSGHKCTDCLQGNKVMGEEEGSAA